MKYLALLFALFVTSAQAETILMTCGKDSFRYSDGFLGLGTPTYEQREDAKWIPFCRPIEETARRIICKPGEKGMVTEYQKPNPKGEWTAYLTETIDFEVMKYVYFYYPDMAPDTYPCKRLNRG